MDPEVSVLLHCADWRGLVKSQVHVELSERFNRQTDPVLEQHIDELWKERIINEPWLFNGAKFRLHSFTLTPPASLLPQATPPTAPQTLCKGEPGVCNMFGTKLQPQLQPGPERDTCRRNKALLTLRLGLTCYKDFLGTNWSQEAGELRRRGETEFGDPLALLAQPLGVGGVLRTRDGQVVLIRRSQRVAEAGGLLDIPGGHPEPKECFVRLCNGKYHHLSLLFIAQAVCEGVCVREDKISVELLQKREEAVVTELFSSVCTEIRDEVNVPMGSLGEPVLMGVALNHTSSGRPSAEFYIRCSLSSAEIRELYWQGGAEAHESTDIVFLSQMDLLQLDKSSPLWSELCPSAKGAVVLYQLVLPDHESDSTKPTQNPSSSTS
ncbi:uridine diphosphate glucose pyrophosphatase NUDT22 isoform X3 [Hypomesus transpacificus]|uniref:uridine diphosphate glucose pyrophosphatase NUDT22 isoform X3 n=1 Tax=Hypomesus transpacificus TaxID=137520 RepID=UPI001F0749C7|nr:uridine diphosphate glucose pyrophosphatase NUDT22 isoform X3 [Hypomesus transpacificus]